jgi:hypothetical protein
MALCARGNSVRGITVCHEAPALGTDLCRRLDGPLLLHGLRGEVSG